MSQLLLKSHQLVLMRDWLQMDVPTMPLEHCREVEPRHRDGKNEELGTKDEEDRKSMCCQEGVGEKGFLCT